MQEEGKGQHEAYLMILARNSAKEDLEAYPTTTEIPQKKKLLMAHLKEKNMALWQDIHTSMRQCGRCTLGSEIIASILRGDLTVSVYF